MAQAVRNTDITSYLASVNAISKAAAERIVTDLFEFIGDSLKNGEEVHIKNFGKFHVKTIKARKGRNPKTGQLDLFPETYRVNFKPTDKLRDTIKNK
ncbi:HU family DNA-binding protein [Achromobacter sp. AGC39]